MKGSIKMHINNSSGTRNEVWIHSGKQLAPLGYLF